MKVHSIKLFNFAKYDQVDVSFDDKVTYLIGKNGAGKSTLGISAIWFMFQEGMITHHGAYLNLETMKVNPITIN